MPIARFSSCAEAWREATEEDGEPHRLEVRHGTGLTDEGFDFSLLSEFRARLLQNGAEQRLFETFLTLGRERGWLKAVANSGRTALMSSPRYVRSIALNVWEKHSGMLSIPSPRSPPTG